MSTEHHPADRRLHALVVGIDHYLVSDRPGARQVGNLGGCVNDARRMATFLRQRLDVPPERLEVLLAPDPPSADAGGDTLPTLANLAAAFERLGARATAGDAVLIHFSGHGVRVRTAFPQWKPGGRDEALVPCDAALGEDGQLRVLRDLELAALLRRLVERGLEVNLVLDSCYSGGAVRGEGRARTLEISGDLPAAEPPRLPLAELEAVRGETAGGATRAFGAGSGWLPVHGFVLLAASAADELAWEYGFPGGSSGVLTHTLLDELSQPVPERTWRRLADRLVARVHGLSPIQTPQIEGDMDRLVFGSGRLATPWAVRVLEAREDGSVLLDAGRAHGIGRGSLFALRTPEAEGGRMLAEVMEAEAVTSRALLRWAGAAPPAGAGPPPAPEPGTLAMPLAPSPGLRRRAVPMPEVPGELVARVERAGAESGSQFLRWGAEGGDPDFRWGVDRNNRFDVRDALGAVLRLEPPLRVEEPGSERRLVDRLDHLARFRNLEGLQNRDPLSALTGRLELELTALPIDYRPGAPLETLPLEPAPGVLTVPAGQWLCLRIRNHSARHLHVALLNFSPTWAVWQVVRGQQIGGAELVDPGGELAVPLRGSIPEGLTESRAVLKVVAATRATSFRWLELPPLEETSRGGAPEGDPRGEMEELFAALSGAVSPGWRNFEAATAPEHDWTTAQIVVRVVPPAAA